MMGLVRRAGSAAALLLLAACNVGPDFERPTIEVPAAYRSARADGDAIANLPWWELLGDDRLTALIETALAENHDVAIAIERIAEARAALGFAKADQYPSFGYRAGVGRSDPGDETFAGRTRPRSDFLLGLDAFFEVDLWGKYRRATEAARADLLATEWAQRTVVISLVAEVATSYVLLLDLDAQLAIGRRTLKSRRDALRILNQRFDKGVVAKLDVHQAEIEEATAAVAVTQLERAIAQAEHALRVLLGRTPGRIERGDAQIDDTRVDVPAGLPSELLQRRPDIRVAEQRAAAQTARIGVAEALRYPSLSLTGALGLNSDDIDEWIDSSARYWSIGAGVAGPLFEFGRNERRVDVETARARQAVLDYERTVLNALREVEDALVAVRTYREEAETRLRQVEAARSATVLARALYDEQFTSYLDVLDTERSLFDAELAESAARRQRLQAVVALYKALGGGWAALREGQGEGEGE